MYPLPWKHEIVTRDGRVIVANNERLANWDGRRASYTGSYDVDTMREFHNSQLVVVPEGHRVEDCSKRVGWNGPSYDPDPVVEYRWPVGTLFIAREHIVSYRKVPKETPDGATFVPRLPSPRPRRSLLEILIGRRSS